MGRVAWSVLIENTLGEMFHHQLVLVGTANGLFTDPGTTLVMLNSCVSGAGQEGRGYNQGSQRPCNFEFLASLQSERAIELGQQVTRKAKRADQFLIDLAGAHSGHRLELDWLPAGQGSADIDTVASDVHQGTSSQLSVEADVAEVAETKAEAAANHARLPDCFCPDEFDHSLSSRVEAVHECFHQLDAVSRGGRLHLATFLFAESKGFFAQDVLSMLSGTDRPLPVQTVGKRDVDGLNRLIS